MISSTVPAHTTSPPWTPAPGPDVHDVVRRLHGILVVLHHDARYCPDPAAACRVAMKLVVVPLVQADAGLVQDIEHPHQGGADLGGQPDALALAARKGARRPRPGSDSPGPRCCRKPSRSLDLLENLLGNHLFPLGERPERLDKAPAPDRPTSRRTRSMLMPPTVTASASFFRRSPWQSGQAMLVMQLLDLRPHPVAAGFLVAALQIVDQRPQSRCL